MAINDVTVANEALALAGTRSSITSFAGSDGTGASDGSNESNAVGAVYFNLRDTALRLADWNFARSVVQLNLISMASGIWAPGQPPPPWQFEYSVPADFLKARKVLPAVPAGLDTGDTAPIGFLVANDTVAAVNQTVILTQEASAILVYTAQVVSPAQWDTVFHQAFVLWLAVHLVAALTGDDARAKGLDEQAKALFETGAAINRREAIGVDGVAPDVALCNRALLTAGFQPITGFTDGSNEANMAAVLYVPTRDQLLRAIDWNFARKVASLALLKTSDTTVPWTNAQPQPPWVYEYAYLPDCLKVRKVLPSSFALDVGTSPSIGFLVAFDDLGEPGGPRTVILSDQQNAIAVYTVNVNRPPLFDPLFTEVLVLRLAQQFALGLADDKKGGAEAAKAYGEQAQGLLEAAAQIAAGEGVAVDGTAQDVQVANRALLAIGAPTITSFADGTLSATVVAALYSSTRDQLIRAAQWNFATKTNYLFMLKFAQGTPEAAAAGDTLIAWDPVFHPALPWLYEYGYPCDCLLMREIIYPVTSNALAGTIPLTSAPGGPTPGMVARSQRFVVTTDLDGIGCPIDVVLTNVQGAVAVYNARICDPCQWDALFTEAMVAALASRLALPLVKDKALRAQNIQAALDALKHARAQDGNEGLAVVTHVPDWIQAHGLASDFPTGPGFGTEWVTPAFLAL